MILTTSLSGPVVSHHHPLVLIRLILNVSTTLVKEEMWLRVAHNYYVCNTVPRKLEPVKFHAHQLHTTNRMVGFLSTANMIRLLNILVTCVCHKSQSPSIISTKHSLCPKLRQLWCVYAVCVCIHKNNYNNLLRDYQTNQPCLSKHHTPYHQQNTRCFNNARCKRHHPCTDFITMLCIHEVWKH